MKNLHNPKAFAKRIRIAMATSGLNQKEVARALDLSISTVCRVLKFKGPDVEGYLRLSQWLTREEHAESRRKEPYRENLNPEPM